MVCCLAGELMVNWHAHIAWSIQRHLDYIMGKNSWFELHRRTLTNDHAFRRNKNVFKKREVDMDPPPPK